MKKLLCLVIVLLLALTVFVACGDDPETTVGGTTTAAPGTTTEPTTTTTAPDTTTTEPVTTTTVPDSSTTEEKPEPQEPTLADDAVDLFGTEDLIGITGIEDHHASLDNHPAVVFWLDNEEIYKDLVGTGYDTEAFNNPKYQWVLTVNGEKVVVEKMSIYDGGTWGYFRCALDAADAYEYVNNQAFFDVVINIVDVESNTIKYYADIKTNYGTMIYQNGMIVDLSKPATLTPVEGATVTAGPDLDGGEGAKKVLDGDIKTKICTGDWGADHAIIVNLGAKKTLRGISLVNANDNAGSTGRTVINFEVWVSEDGENWGEAAAWLTTGEGINKADVSANFMERFYDFDKLIDATYVKLVINNGEMYQLSEVIFFEGPQPVEEICINDIEGVSANVYAFEKPSEFGGPIGLIYHFDAKGTGHNTTIAKGIADGKFVVYVTLNGEKFLIEQFANGINAEGNSDNWFRFNVESVGAVIYSGVEYEVVVEVWGAEDNELYYYTKPEIKASTLTSKDAPEREATNVELPEGLGDAAIDKDTATVDGLGVWGDASVDKLFDGDTVSTKLGGGANGIVTVTFSTKKAITATYYTLYTGGDSATWTGRNPAGWTLYGKVGEEWVVLAAEKATTETVPGLKDVDSTPFTYKIDNEQECTEYKIEFVAGGALQLNEMKLHYVLAEGEDPDAEKDERSDYLTVGQMKDITANGTGCAFNVHDNFCSLVAGNKLEVGFASAGQFTGDNVPAILASTKLAKAYLNGVELEITDDMYSTAEHWKLYFQLDLYALIDGQNELVVKIVPGEDATGCNFDSYYGIYKFNYERTAVCINDLEVEGLEARVHAFEKSSEFGGPIGLTYYFDAKDNGLHTTIADGIANGTVIVKVTLNGETYTVTQFANGAPWFRLNVESAGATLFSGVQYEIVVEFITADTRYYTKAETKACSFDSADAPARESANVELPEGLINATVKGDSITSEGIDTWGDGPATNLFDGDVEGTKIGGGANGLVTVTFSTTEAFKATYYTLYTGGDSGDYHGRNPLGWTLYGKVGEEWVVLSEVKSTTTTIPGIQDVNKTPFSYKIDNPTECTEYKIVFLAGGVLQLNELILQGVEEICLNDIENADAHVHAFEKSSEFGGPIGLTYYFDDKDNKLHDALVAAIADGTLTVKVTLNGETYTIEQFANGGTWFRLNVESAGASLYEGAEYEIVVEFIGTGVRYYTKAETKPCPFNSADAAEAAGNRTPANVELPEFVAGATVDSDSITLEGMSPWGDGENATKLFDGNTTGSKLGGGSNAYVTVTFKTTEAFTASYYTIYTGLDSGTWTGRNPYGWTLYGKVGEEWVVLSEVKATATTVCGLVDANSKPFSYKIDEPKECTEYKIVFVTRGTLQLNEFVLQKEVDPDSKDTRSDYLTVGQMSEITAGDTGCAFNVHAGTCGVQADGKLRVGFASTNQFSGDYTAELKTLKLAKAYLNGKELEITDGMFSTQDWWLLYFQLNTADLVIGKNELVVKIVPGPDSTTCNYDSYYGIYQFNHAFPGYALAGDAVNLDTILASDIMIEEHGSLDLNPSLVFALSHETIYPALVGTPVDSFVVDSKYKLFITINGTPKEIERINLYHGGTWGYLRCDLVSLADIETVNGVAEIVFKVFFVDTETNTVKYYLDVEAKKGAMSYRTNMIEDANKPEGLTKVEGVTCVSGPDMEGGEGAPKAFDGNIRTKICTGDNGPDNAIVASLGATKTLKGISLVNANDNAGSTGRTVINFEVWVSADGENWGDAAAWSTDGAGVNKGDVSENFLERYYDFGKDVEATYVKLVINNGELYQFSEIIFYA